MDTKIYNLGGLLNSLQVSTVKDVPEGNFNPGIIFLIKNNTDEDIQVTIVPAGQEDEITTTLYSGWNPELVRRIVNAPATGLQYGY